MGRGKVVTSHQYAFGKSNQLTNPKVSLVSNSTRVDIHSFSQVIIDEKVPFKLNFQRLHFFFLYKQSHPIEKLQIIPATII